MIRLLSAYSGVMPPEKSLSSEPLTLIEFVRDAEGARVFLQGELDYARTTRADLAAQLELMLLYGRAFAQLTRRLPEEIAAEPWQARILHEAVVGRTAFWEWQRRTTSAVAPLELYQIQLRWENIVEIIAETFG